MPTYGRPTLVQNAIACFQAQDYPADRRRLLILDDAGQIASQHGEGWSVWSTSARMETLAAKYVELDLLDAGWADAFVIWDDDDIYLPWHLAAYAAALQNSRWAHPAKVWDLYTGRLELGPAKGRFWASAAVRTDFLRSLGGFTESARGDFDQINLRAGATTVARRVGLTRRHTSMAGAGPTIVPVLCSATMPPTGIAGMECSRHEILSGSSPGWILKPRPCMRR